MAGWLITYSIAVIKIRFNFFAALGYIFGHLLQIIKDSVECVLIGGQGPPYVLGGEEGGLLV